MEFGFLGEYTQKVDAKGRMSIPADFRRVLEDGDPDFSANSLPRLVVLYGPHLKNCLHVYTVNGMAEIAAGIARLKRGSDERRRASSMILGKAWKTEVDKDGRIILPMARREQVNLTGEAKMIGLGEYFELWNSDTYAAHDGADDAAYLEERGEGFDPLTLLDDFGGA